MSALHIAATEKRLLQVLEILEDAHAENAKLTTRLQRIEAAAREALSTLDLAMEISMKYEPCGYYCDERVGHVDHKLFNWARETKGKLIAALDESKQS